jgi:ABC-type bacteriocin/lantibiotic exporter with double-glycine peptidase domain
MHNLPISKDAFFWALSITSQLYCIPLPSSVVMQRHQPPYTLGMLRLVAAQRGLKVRHRAFPSSQTDQLPIPCLVAIHAAARARVTANGGTVFALAPEFELALLQSVDDKWVVIVETCGGSPITMSREDFARRFTGEAILIAPRDSTNGDSPRSGNTQPEPVDIAINPSRGRQNDHGLTWVVPRLRWLKAALRLAR